jgi:hypothetical protein
MSTRFKDIPAEEWEQTFCAEELAEERKADKKERGRVSGYALSFTALLEAGGVSPDVYQAVHVFLALTKNHAPEEAVRGFSEKDAGERLPGNPDVAYESLRKRFIRAWSIIEQEQARTGKCFAGRREKGSIKLASRKSDAKKIGPKYFSQIAQSAVDVQRIASNLRGYREDRYRRAALEVWNKLPAFTEGDITIPPENTKTSENSGGSKSSQSAPSKYPRRLDRFVRAAREMLSEAKKRGDSVAQATGKELAMELCKVFAETLDVEPESAMRLLADTLTEAADAPVHSNNESSLDKETVQSVYEEKREVGGTNFFADPQISEQKRENDASHVYEPVHVEQESEPGYCAACGDRIHPDRLAFDARTCDLCGPPRPQPKQGNASIIYAEDFTV